MQQHRLRWVNKRKPQPPAWREQEGLSRANIRGVHPNRSPGTTLSTDEPCNAIRLNWEHDEPRTVRLCRFMVQILCTGDAVIGDGPRLFQLLGANCLQLRWLSPGACNC